MHAMSAPYIQITDPDELELSDENEKSESSAETIGSPCTTGDADALISRSYEDEKEQQAAISDQSRLRILGWMIANTSATIGSVRSGSLRNMQEYLDYTLTFMQVFINKMLFNTSTFKYDQLSFAAYQFGITGVLLCILSSARFGHFEVRSVKTLEILPLSISLCMSVVVSNLSLAYSSPLYYQIVRALIPPCVVAINYILHKTMVPRMALMALIPMCMDVAMVTYYNPGSLRDHLSLPTTSKGVILAFAGVVMTALHTAWMDVFLRRYKLDATQLLANESPLSSIVLLYVVPWADTLPVWKELPKNTWWLLLLVRLSQ